MVNGYHFRGMIDADSGSLFSVDVHLGSDCNRRQYNWSSGKWESDGGESEVLSKQSTDDGDSEPESEE